MAQWREITEQKKVFINTTHSIQMCAREGNSLLIVTRLECSEWIAKRFVACLHCDLWLKQRDKKMEQISMQKTNRKSLFKSKWNSGEIKTLTLLDIVVGSRCKLQLGFPFRSVNVKTSRRGLSDAVLRLFSYSITDANQLHVSNWKRKFYMIFIVRWANWSIWIWLMSFQSLLSWRN